MGGSRRTSRRDGIKAIDAMTPIGVANVSDHRRRKTGKTTVAIDSIINERGLGVKCIDVAIGQRLTVAQTVETRGNTARRKTQPS